MLQLFYIYHGNHLVLIFSKIVDEILFTGLQHIAEEFTRKIDCRFTVGTGTSSPGLLIYFGLNIIQEDLSISIDTDDKLRAIEFIPLSRLLRKQVEGKPNPIQISACAYFNSSIGWLLITA